MASYNVPQFKGGNSPYNQVGAQYYAQNKKKIDAQFQADAIARSRTSTVYDNSPQAPMPKGPSLVSALGNALLKPFKYVAEAPIEARYRPQIVENKKRIQKANDDLLKTATKAYKDGKLSKEKYQKIVKSVSKETLAAAQQVQESTDIIQEKADAKKFAGALTEVGLTPFALSTKGMVKGAQVVNAATKVRTAGSAAEGTMLAKKLAGIGVVPSRYLTQPKIGATIAQQALLGGATNAAGTAAKDGATAGDYVKNFAIGAGLSAGLVGGADLAVKGVDKGVKAAASAAKSGIMKTETGKKLADILSDASQRVGNDLRYVQDSVKGMVDDAGRKVDEHVTKLVRDVRSAPAYAESARANNVGVQELRALTQGKKSKELTPYKQEIADYQTLVNKAKLAGKPAPAWTGSAEGRKMYEALNKSTKQVIQDWYDNGIITKADYDNWISDPNYVRMQHKVNEHMQKSGLGGAELSMGKSVSSQKLRGSSKEAIDPFAAFLDWHTRATREVLANKAATYYTEQLAKAGKATQLRNAEDVMRRKEIQKFLAETKPGKKFAARMVRKYSRELRRLQTEVDKLNKKGLDESLGLDRTAKGKDDAFRYQTEEYISGAKRVKNPKDVSRSISAPKEITGSLKTAQTIEGGANSNEVRQLMEDLIATDSSTLRSIRKKIANREPKLAKLIDDITEQKDQLEAFNIARGDAWKEMLAKADAATRGKATISRMNQGYKEIFEVDPKIASVVKSMDPVQLGRVGQIVALPARVLRTGATAANVAFTLPNYVADQLGSAIISRNARNTHNIAAMAFGLKESFKYTANDVFGTKFKLDDVAQEYLKLQAQATGPNLSRNLRNTIRQSNKELGIKGTVWDKTMEAGRRFEDIISSSEHATRMQNFVGMYRGKVDELGHERALEEAVKASRMNSVDFGQRGEWANAMSWLNPYLNASIQGVRTTAKSFADRPTATSLKIAGLLVAPTVASTYHNLSDPERAMAYANLSEYTRANNAIWVIRGGDDPIIISIKLPPGLKSMVKPARNIVEAQYLDNRQSFLEDAKNILVDPFSPIGGSKGEVLSSLTPQPLKPTIEAATNYSFFSGENIVKGNMKDLPPEEQVYKTTGSTYRDIGKFLGVSPLIVNQFVRSTGGGGGEQLFNAVDRIRRASGESGVVVDNRGTWSQVTGRFEKGNQKNVQTQFYDRYNIAKTINKSGSKKVTEAVKAGDYDKARQIADDTNALVQATMKEFDKTYGKYSTSEQRDEFAKLVKEALINTDYKNLKRRAKN